MAEITVPVSVLLASGEPLVFGTVVPIASNVQLFCADAGPEDKIRVKGIAIEFLPNEALSIICALRFYA